MRAKEQESLFREWLSEHRGLLFKVVRAYATGPEDQEDLFQEIAFQIWSSIPSFRGQAKPSTWLYRVALNTALAWQRRENRHLPKHKVLTAPPEDLPAAAHETHSAGNREILDRLYAEIHKLHKVSRSLVLLYLDGYSYREMAEILGISESNVGVRLNRVKKQLADSLTKET